MIQCGQGLKKTFYMRCFFGNAHGLRYTKDQFNLALYLLFHILKLVINDFI